MTLITIVDENRMPLEHRIGVVKVLKEAIACLEEKKNCNAISEQLARLRVIVAEREQIIEKQGADILRGI